MKKTEILEGLQNYKDRLTGEVLDAYKSRGGQGTRRTERTGDVVNLVDL